MSGGSLSYKYIELLNLASLIRERAENELEISFADHIEEVAQAAKDLEWKYSGDSSDYTSNESIKKVLKRG